MRTGQASPGSGLAQHGAAEGGMVEDTNRHDNIISDKYYDCY